jgi:hypothetical protein
MTLRWQIATSDAFAAVAVMAGVDTCCGRYRAHPACDGQRMGPFHGLPPCVSVRQGCAQMGAFPPTVKYEDLFLQRQREAREAKCGLWGRCP